MSRNFLCAPCARLLSRQHISVPRRGLVTSSTGVEHSPSRTCRQAEIQTQTKNFSTTAPAPGWLSRTKQTYQVLGLAQKLYKTCARHADYSIPEAERKADTVRTTDDGEELGVSLGGQWHSSGLSLVLNHVQAS